MKTPLFLTSLRIPAFSYFFLKRFRALSIDSPSSTDTFIKCLTPYYKFKIIFTNIMIKATKIHRIKDTIRYVQIVIEIEYAVFVE